MISNGWEIDTTPYHITNKSKIDNGSYLNSLDNNTHTFNVAKYYKQQFQNIPRLQKYDVVVWIDGTLEIIYDKTSKYILDNIYKYKIIGWDHEHRRGLLKNEVNASTDKRYSSTFWNNQSQPIQDIKKQYSEYLLDGFDESFFKKLKNNGSDNFGVWVTCFVAFLNKDPDVTKFLDLWYLQTLKYTTQDQVSFPYVVQKTNIIPLTLPNKEVTGNRPHDKTMFYIKHNHGK
jgi:hypothetical protein